MWYFVLAFLTTGDGALAENAQPALACSEHVTNDRARRSCLRDLLETAEADMAQAAGGAREEAELADADTGGMFDAEGRLDAAQSAWLTYRDAECARRSALMILSDDARTEVDLVCRVGLTYARARELREE